jgi:hypothetical protein
MVERNNRWILAVLLFITVGTFGLWLWRNDVASDRGHTLEVLEPITLLKNAPRDSPKANAEVGKVLPGETTEVLRVGYGKDFRAWLIRGPKGQEGWFIENSNNVKVSWDT